MFLIFSSEKKKLEIKKKNSFILLNTPKIKFGLTFVGEKKLKFMLACIYFFSKSRFSLFFHTYMLNKWFPSLRIIYYIHFNIYLQIIIIINYI
jgi:hypothetical protein